MAVIPIPQHILQSGLIETSDILNLYYLLTNALPADIVLNGGLTVADLLTANGGLTVPSGQTLTVPPATASGQAVQQAQVINSAFTLTNETANRVLGTTYTNSNPRPLIAYVTAYGSSTSVGYLYGQINGENISESDTTSAQGKVAITLVVPPGCTYSALSGGGDVTLQLWWEQY
jgi:hypothetical protein